MSCHAKKQKSLSGESPGKFNQWIRRPRLGSPAYVGAARNMSSERGKSCERSSLLLFCLLFLGTAFSSVYHRPIVEEGRIEKWNSLMFLHSPALLFTADVEDGRLEIGFIVSWGLFIPLLLISQRVRFLDPLKEKILKIYFSVPQCFPRNDRILMVLSAYQSKIFKEGCEKGVLMQYKCMEKEIRKLHGRILFPSVMYIAIIPAGMQLWQKEIKNPCIQSPDFPLPPPRRRRSETDSADS